MPLLDSQVRVVSFFGNFADIVIDAESAQVLTNLSGVPDGNDPLTFRFEGPRLRPTLLTLAAHASWRVAGGRPQRNLSGFTAATADPGGQIVTVEWMEGEARELTGIYTLPDAQLGPDGHRRQAFTMVVWACQRLRFYGLGDSDYQDVTDELS